jgi:hypothetical protein
MGPGVSLAAVVTGVGFGPGRLQAVRKRTIHRFLNRFAIVFSSSNIRNRQNFRATQQLLDWFV